MKNSYKDRYAEVIRSGKYNGVIPKLVRLAELNAANYRDDKSYTKDDFIVMALEDLEAMTGIYLDPTQGQWDYIKGWMEI